MGTTVVTSIVFAWIFPGVTFDSGHIIAGKPELRGWGSVAPIGRKCSTMKPNIFKRGRCPVIARQATGTMTSATLFHTIT